MWWIGRNSVFVNSKFLPTVHKLNTNVSSRRLTFRTEKCCYTFKRWLLINIFLAFCAVCLKYRLVSPDLLNSSGLSNAGAKSQLCQAQLSACCLRKAFPECTAFFGHASYSLNRGRTGACFSLTRKAKMVLDFCSHTII